MLAGIFFVAVGCISVFRDDKKPVNRFRGPVHDPFKVGRMWKFESEYGTQASSLEGLKEA